MADDLKWAFTLIDKVSGEATKMEKALLKVEKTLGDGSKATLVFQKSMGAVEKQNKGAVNSFAGFSGPLGLLTGGLMKAGEMALGLVETVMHLAETWGVAGIKAIGFKESTINTFTALAQYQNKASMTPGARKTAANDSWNEAMMYADFTPYKTNEVISNFKQMAGVGYSKKESRVLFEALSDLAIRNGGGQEDISAMMMQITEAKGIGKFSMRHLMPILSRIGVAGGAGELYDSIGEAAGLKGLTHEQIAEKVSSGELDTDKVINGLVNVIEKNVSGGQLGSVTKSSGTGWTGMLSTIESLPEKLMGEVNLNMPGLERLKKFLQDFIMGATLAIGPGGKLNKLMNDLVDSVSGWVGSLDAASIIDKVSNGLDLMWQGFNAVLDAGNEFWLTIRPNLIELGVLGEESGARSGDGMRKFGDALAFVSIMAGGVVNIFTRMILLMDEAAKGINEWSNRVGIAGFLDFVQGKQNTRSQQEYQQKMIAAGIMSPDGAFASEDPNAQRESVGSPASSFTPAPMFSAPQVRSTGALVEQNVTVHMPVQVDASQADAEGVARHISQQLPAALNTTFASLKTESGG